MKKGLLAALLSVVLLAGCGAPAVTESTAGTNSPAATSPAAGDEGDAASSGEPGMLSIALAQNTNVENYDTNYLTGLLESELNIDFEFVYLPSAADDAKTKFSIMVSSNAELPDVVINPGLSVLEVADYGSKGVFLPLNDYIASAEHFNSVFTPEDKALALQASTAPDGNIYALVGFAIEPPNQVPFKMWINDTWLKAVNMEMPTTTEEYHQVLKAFAEQDANGNGQPDEIGITGSKGGWGCQPVTFLMNSFVFYPGKGVNGGLALGSDGATVVAPFTTEEWRAGLEYMNMLHSEGLLSPTMFTQDDAQFTALLSNEQPIVGSAAAGGYGYWAGSSENPNFQEMRMLPPLEGPNGVAYNAYFDYTPQLRYLITKDCDNPDLAFKLGDLFFRHDMSMSGRYGEEGVDWSEDPEVTKNYKGLFEDSEGIKCEFVQLEIQWSKVQNKHWYDATPNYRNLDAYKKIDGEYPEDPNARNFRAEYTNGSVSYYYDARPEKILPSALIYTLEEADSAAEIQANIVTFVDQSIAEFVTGNRPLTDWDAYIAELNNMGLVDWLASAQQAYDRMTAA